MRIWSVHPKYLDAKGLVALWRETLLAKHVLEDKTKGYTNHPQLTRFKKLNNPLDGINQYLGFVFEEAVTRGYNFNKDKIAWDFTPTSMHVTTGQIQFEIKHLLKKLKVRDDKKYNEMLAHSEIIPHPLFKVVIGEIEDWEII